jgi:hypothetical protein
MKTKTHIILRLVVTVVVTSSMLIAFPTIASAEPLSEPRYQVDQSSNTDLDNDWIKECGTDCSNQELSSCSIDGIYCCNANTMRLAWKEYTNHHYKLPLPAVCSYELYRIHYCTYCNAVWETVFVGSSTHTHY